jgi:hypothetical protein
MESPSNERNDMRPERKQAEDGYSLLKKLLELLEGEQDRNWIRGVKSALQELTDSNGCVTEDRFESARSIYRAMTVGGRGFSEYFVWREDEDARISKNRELDYLREKLWEVFG